MADDDKGAKPGTVSAEHSPAASDKSQLTEWTASDRRGPLDAAGEPEIERVVPAHEMDAEGGVDPVAADHGDHDQVVESSEAPAAHRNDDVREGSFRGDAGNDEVSHDSALSESEHDALHTGEESTADVTPGPYRPVGDPSAQTESGRSLVPVAVGLVVGALIGAGSAWLVYSQSGDAGAQQQIVALSSRVDALDKRPDPQPAVTKLQSGLFDLQGKMAAVEKQVTGSSKVAATADPQAQGGSPQSSSSGSSKPQQQTAAGQQPSAATLTPADAGMAGKIAGLQAAIDELKTRTAAMQAQDSKESGDADKIQALQGNLSGAQKQVADAQKQAEAARSALDAVKGEQKRLGDKLAGLTIAVAGALKKADGAQSGVDSVQTKQKALEGKLGSPALAVVTDSLVQQIDAGQPYARQVDALASLKADPARISVLRENASGGVPSARALLAKWKPLADPVIATGNNAPANANFGQRLQHGLFGLVSVRRNDGTTDNDLTSRVNLIEADLSHDDVTGAYAVWQKLPDAAKAKSQDWGTLAKTSVEALGAARDLQHSAIDALGANKS